jgi:DNA-binding transcriptional MerR regulator
VKTIDISELGRRAGLPASTLRHYEACGLISSVGRRGLRRVFDESVVERLALIALGRVAGFSLEEIARMFAPDGTPRIDRSLLLAKARELTATIQKLAAMRQGLRHAAACKAPTHMECPTFRRLLKAAASGRWGRAPAPKPVPRPRTPQTLARKAGTSAPRATSPARTRRPAAAGRRPR